ncbi:MAG: ATP-binding cassette domain-containing protein [Candidatus Methanomethylicaceae archaeon]|nr:ATP-binding cassette domain-containing protein [Candidatus Verstraetearchaeota archaeon]
MIIKTFGITKRFKKILAVDHIDLTIEEGEIFGLLGPNGAGKTTLLMMLATLIKPTEGTAKINGYDILENSKEVRKSIGVVFQVSTLDDLLTGWENLYLHSLMYGVPANMRKTRIEEVLDLVGLRERSKDLVKTYSGGMKRRLELARGLLHKPKILLLDEPTLGLDPQTRVSIWDYIKKLSKEEGVTILITTHYMEEADILCDRIAIIDKGKIKALDSPRNLKMKIGKGMIKAITNNPNIKELKKLPYVNDIEVNGNEVKVYLSEVGIHAQEILEKLGETSYIELREPTLNDVFLQLTGREIKHEEPEDLENKYIRSMK